MRKKFRGLENYIRERAETLGVPFARLLQLHVLPDPCNVMPAARYDTASRRCVIWVPVMLFYEDSGQGEGCWQDRERFARWTEDAARVIEGLRAKKAADVPWQTLALIGCFTRQRDLAVKALDFTLMHELGHLYLRHKPPSTLIGGSPTCAWAFIANRINTLYLSVRALFSANANRQQEREADQFALNSSHGAVEGAIYLFETLTAFQRQLRGSGRTVWERLAHRIAFSPSGNNRLLYLSHPSETERLAQARALMTEGRVVRS